MLYIVVSARLKEIFQIMNLKFFLLLGHYHILGAEPRTAGGLWHLENISIFFIKTALSLFFLKFVSKASADAR